MEALIIVDMSNDFVHDNGGLTAGKPAQEIVDGMLEVIMDYHKKGCPVVFAMDAHEENDEHFKLWPSHNVKGTWGQKLFGKLDEWHEEHKDEENVIWIDKPEYDAFYKTELAEILKASGVDEVLIGGVCTDICVFNTVYGAYKEGFKTKVDPKLCATFTDNGEIFINQMNAIYKTEIV